MCNTVDSFTQGGLSQDGLGMLGEYQNHLNYKKNHGNFDGYPVDNDEYTRKLDLRDPDVVKQYTAWNDLTDLMGVKTEFLDKLPLSFIDKDRKGLFFVDAFEECYKGKMQENFYLIHVCGMFWKNKPDKREAMINFMGKKMQEHQWGVAIYTQDETLEEDFKKTQYKMPKIYYDARRVSMHYTIVRNDAYLENSHIFLELPHSEKLPIRLDIHFPFGYVQQRLKCDIFDFLDFLGGQRKEVFNKQTN